VLDPAVQGTHLKEWTLRSMLQTDFARRGVPWAELMLERRDVPTTLNLGRRERAGAAASLVAVGAILRRRPAVATAALGVQLALNTDLYGLLARRLGARGVVAGMGLHALHHAAGAAAVATVLARRAGTGS
jgi:hypothetical protein